MAYRDVILATTGLIAFWDLDEAEGPTAFDSGTGGYNGTYSDWITYGVTGLSGKCITLGGDGHRVTVADAPALQLVATSPGCTMECIVRGSVSAGHDKGWFISKYSTGGVGFEGYGFGLASNYPSLFSGGNWYNSTFEHTTTVFHHYAVTILGTTATFYADGVEAGTATGVYTPFTTDSALTMGTDSVHHWAAESFTGEIDAVAIYSVALSGSTIAAHYAAATTTGPPLTALYARCKSSSSGGIPALDPLGSMT